MKKTLLFISILLALFIALTGCSGTPESDKAETPVTPVTPAPNPDTPPIGGTSTGPTSPFSVGQSAVWVNMTVTLNDGITFREIEGEKDVTAWFKGLPEGVKAWTYTRYTEGSNAEKAKAAVEKDGKDDEGSTTRYIAVKEGERTLKFKFTGTVDNEPSEKFALVIPSGFTSAGHDISIEIKAGQSIIVDNRIKVTFDLGGGYFESGSPSTWVQIIDNKRATRPAEDPKREGYRFLKWVKEGETTEFNFYTDITESIKIVALWDSIIPFAPTFEEIASASDDYHVTVRIYKNNIQGRVWYTLNGTEPVVESKACPYFDSSYFDVKVVRGTTIKAFSRSIYGEQSDTKEHNTVKLLDFYGYGTETKSPRESTLTSLTYPPRDRKIATFTPGVNYLLDIVGSTISEPSEYKNGENDFHIFNIFDCGDGRLLVVAKYGYNGVTTSNRKIFYYYIEKTTGNKTSDPPVEISGLSGVADNNFLYHTEYVQLIGNKLYFACDYQTKPAVWSYNLETKEVKKIIYDSTYSSSIVIADTFTYGTRMYLLGNTGYECHVWGLDTEDEESWIHMKLSSEDKGLKGASDGSFLYVVLNEGDSSASGYNKKKLVKATLSGSSSENSTCYLETKYCVDSNGSISIGDVAVVNGSLLIAGSEGCYETTGTRLQVKRPCIWTSEGKETILLEKTDFPISCGYITPHTIQVLDGKVYILTDNHYDAYGGSNLPYYTETVHGGVIEMDSRRIWDFGNGFYYGALYARVNYFYIKTN